ncbi:MAG: amidase [Hyphomicrobiales bacterium]|nr:amidase [Hyphomicrobiales bacterium]
MTRLHVNTARAPHRLSASEAAQAIATGRLTAEDLVRDCLNRIADRESVVRAWAALDADGAIAQARACDAGPRRGILHGIPIGVKDVLNTTGLPTQMGSPIYANHRTRNDASCVALLRAAGAIVVGKTVTCEFAGVAPGLTTNPHDAARTPGGSSSGSAAAVADAMVPIALGTQTGGSVLRPASFCGVIGYKPTYGLFNREGLKFAAESLDTIGLFARELDDIALVAAVLTGQEPVAPKQPTGPLRIGLCHTYLWETKASPETRTCIEAAAHAFERAGAQVETFKLPDHFEQLTQAREIINDVERARSLAWEWTWHRDQLSPQLIGTIERGLATPDKTYRSALLFAERARSEMDAKLSEFDGLLAPCVNGEAPLGLAYAGDPAFQGLWTLLHTPTIALPACRGPNQMPVALQLVARRGADEKLIALARWAQEAAEIGMNLR